MVEALEGVPVSPGRWILALAAIIALRHFLEQVAGERRILYFLSYCLHYPLAYVAPLLALTVVLAVFARERADRVARLMLFAWLLTLLPPLLDMLVSRGRRRTRPHRLPHPEERVAVAGVREPAEPRVSRVPGADRRHPGRGGGGMPPRRAVRAPEDAGTPCEPPARSSPSTQRCSSSSRCRRSRSPSCGRSGPASRTCTRLVFDGGSVHRAFTGAPPFALSDLSSALLDLFVIVPLLAVWYRMADRDGFRSAVRLFDPLAAGLHAALVCLGIALARSIVLASVGAPMVAHPFDVAALAGLLVSAVLMQPAAAALAAAHGGEKRPRRGATEGGRCLPGSSSSSSRRSSLSA